MQSQWPSKSSEAAAALAVARFLFALAAPVVAAGAVVSYVLSDPEGTPETAVVLGGYIALPVALGYAFVSARQRLSCWVIASAQIIPPAALLMAPSAAFVLDRVWQITLAAVLQVLGGAIGMELARSLGRLQAREAGALAGD